jgi:hypothetical protein
VIKKQGAVARRLTDHCIRGGKVGSIERIGKLVTGYILVLILPVQSYSDAFMHSFCRRKIFAKSGGMHGSGL